MGVALLVMIEKTNNDLHIEIQTEQNRCHARSDFLSGRQVLRKLYKFIATHPLLRRVFGLQDICKMTYTGDNDMHNFYYTLTDVIENRSPTIKDDDICDTLWLMLENKSEALRTNSKNMGKQ